MKAFDSSGETQRAFCESRGIAYSTFCYWRRRLRTVEQAPASEPAPVELPMWVGRARKSGDYRVELDLGDGMVLRLR
ncbi:MAG: IS66 family insertion sequence element accessory protein TnpB [Gammaproteobacteria bacterium]|nr:IS66 family insertion sequence element accessory protein TnpB [Gammaproteobacteria bacterium]